MNVPVPSVCFSALFGLLAFMSVPNSVGPNNVPFVIGYLMLGVFIPRRLDGGMLRAPVGCYLCYVPALSAGREGSTFD